jgi:hypothetical protein
MRKLRSVLVDKWEGRVRPTPQLRRDLQWWTHVPSHANGKNTHRPVESAYIQCDSSGYGWGAVLNGKLEARGFWGPEDEQHHITWEELKAVRLAVLSFLPHTTNQANTPSVPNHSRKSTLQDRGARLQQPLGRLDAPLHATPIGH